jgi:hypothetical protein
MKWPRLLLLAVVLVLLTWAWVALHPSPEKLIRRQLDGVARAASFGPNQGALAKLAGAESLEDYFSTNVDIMIDVPGHHEHRLMTRSEIPQVAMGVRTSVRSLSVAFPDVTLIINADQESAIADATLQVKVADEPDMIVQEVKVTLHKTKGQWLIVKVETVRTLQ